MGSKLSNFVRPDKRHEIEVKKLSVLVLGLDGAGKSTLISHLDAEKFGNGESDNYLHPTTALSMHRFKYLDMKWVVWDMSGRAQYRKMWNDFYQQSMAIVFVVDASRILRLGVVKEEWKRILQHPSVKRRKTPILVMLNKLDHATDTDDPHVTLNQIRNVLPEEEHGGEVQYRTCSGMTGEGIGEGFQWIATTVKDIVRSSKGVNN